MAENILIVGNGFDLSHYLPTKYDHFMDVMNAIEENNSDTMSFEDLFAKCRENWFIAKTKEYYQIESIHLDEEKLNEIRELLKENCWYQYFKNHVQEIKTWIDFEKKIEEALKLVSAFLIKVDDNYKQYGKLVSCVRLLENKATEDQLVYVSEVDFNLLKILRLCKENCEYGKSINIINNLMCFTGSSDNDKRFISDDWFNVKDDPKYGISKSKYLDFLYKELECFSKIFNIYLIKIIDILTPLRNFEISEKSNSLLNPIGKNKIFFDFIYSFNYTYTYSKNYRGVATEYLHGNCGENQNIILGISDLHDNSLKELKAYGFTKYHQKLFKNTDYLFIDSYKEKVAKKSQKLSELKEEWKFAKAGYKDSIKDEIAKIEKEMMLNLNISIWGHSLDLSDRDYIEDIFSLNDEIDRGVRVVVYYFDNSAKFSLLNNLLAILGKDKVEKWMKKKWLQFKPNPQIDFGVEQQQQIA